MRPALFCSSILSLVFSTAVFANAGVTSSGVTTTVGNSNDPSAEVQAQSSGFVQQNQQLQNGKTPNGTAPSNTAVAVLPNTANGPAGANNAGNADNNPGSPRAADPAAAAAAAVAAAATPPPPPPVYSSAIRRIEHPQQTTVEASGPPDAVRKQDSSPPAEPAQHDAAAKATPAPIAAAAPAKPLATPPAAHPEATPHNQTSAERPAPPAAVTGGRGEAPDGFTFYSGSAIAGMLLAFAFATYLKTGRNESAK